MNGLYQLGGNGYLKIDCECGKRNFSLISGIDWDVTVDGRLATAEFKCKGCDKEYNVTCKPMFLAPAQVE